MKFLDTPISDFVSALTFGEVGAAVVGLIVLWASCQLILQLRD